jgi:hypothetical protein
MGYVIKLECDVATEIKLPLDNILRSTKFSQKRKLKFNAMLQHNKDIPTYRLHHNSLMNTR